MSAETLLCDPVLRHGWDGIISSQFAISCLCFQYMFAFLIASNTMLLKLGLGKVRKKDIILVMGA